MNIKISQLPAAVSLNGNEAVPISVSGETRRTTVQAIADLAAGGLVSVAFTDEIPFDAGTTTVGAYDMADGDLVLTPNSTGAKEGATAQMTIKGRGVNTLDLSAFEGIGDIEFPNVDGTDYQFFFDCLSVSPARFGLVYKELTTITAPGANAAPVASSVAFTGTQTEGSTLTGTYSYSDTESDAQGTSLKKWYRSDNGSGLNRAAISGATNSTYVLQAADVGKYIQFAVTPKAVTGTITGTEVFSSYSGAIGAGAAWATLDLDIAGGGGHSFAGTTYTLPVRQIFSSSHKVAAGTSGSFRFQRTGTDFKDTVIGFNTASSAVVYTSMATSLYCQAADGSFAAQNGSGNTASGTIPLGGYIEFDVYLSGGAMRIDVFTNDGTTRTAAGSMTSFSASDNVCLCIDGNINSFVTTKIYNPQGINLT